MTKKKKALKKAKVKKKWVLTLDKVMDCLAGKEDQQTVVLALLKDMDQLDRVRYVTDMFTKSKFKSYTMAMQKFTYTMYEFLRTKNTAIVKSYFDQYVDDKKGPGYNFMRFSRIRNCIINDALHNNPTKACEAMFNLIDYEHRFANITEQPKEMLPYIAELASKKWKSAKGLKVLYGDTKE